MRKSLITSLFTTFAGVSATLASLSVTAHGQTFTTKSGTIKVEKIVGGLDTPWAMAMLPNGSLLVTERDGEMLLIDPANPDKKKALRGVPKVAAAGQGGLLDVVLDPAFAQNRTIYFSYSMAPGNGGTGTAVARATLDTERARLEDVKVIYRMKKLARSSRHFGSRIVPDGNGNLFFTIGDRGTQPRAQDPFDAAGSVLRISTDGAIPQDNPYADGKKALPQIWSTGHRNPQGATRHPQTGDLWTVSHGARGGDEINIPKAGLNYGWPTISYGQNYSGTKIGVGQSADGLEQPIYFWDPSIAPSGMDFYEDGQISAWNGDLFVGALSGQALVRLDVQGNTIVSEERLFEGDFGRIRDVRFMPDKALYFLTNDGDSGVYRVVPN